MTTSRSLRVLTLAIAAACISTSGTAAVTSIATELGADSATRSTATGLDWLDLDRSIASVAETDARLAHGGSLQTWRRATTAEVVAFWLDAGVTVTGSGAVPGETSDPAQLAAILNLQQLVGYTFPKNPSTDLSVGYTAEPGPSPDLQTVAYLFSRYDGVAGAYFAGAAITDAAFPSTPPNPDTEIWGSWLVRSYEVPEPGMLGLLGLGVLGLAASRRRRV